MIRSRLLPAMLLGASIAALGPVQAQTSPSRIRGDITAVDRTTLQIRDDGGQTVPVRLAGKLSISARSRADQSQIGPGVFLGTTAAPGPDGSLVASEVHIFAESMRGVGEGHRPMDPVSGSTMTNATVALVSAGRTMTNATVAGVNGDDWAKRMTLRYSGGEKVVTVPKDTPVVMVEPGDASMLVTGAHVVVSGTRQSDGSILADRIQVGKDGFVPPL